MNPKLVQVFAETLDVDPASIVETTSPKTVPSWDSLASLNLLAAVEKAFGVSFTMEETLAMEDVGAVSRILATKLG